MNDPYYVLGISGWPHNGHDASVAIIRCSRDGVCVLGLLEEEKICRHKYAEGILPTSATSRLLKELRICPDQIDALCFSFDEPMNYSLRSQVFPYTRSELTALLFGHATSAEIIFCDHHTSHAYAALAMGSLKGEEDSVLVLDGSGEEHSSSLFLIKGGRPVKFETSDFSASLGFLYNAAAKFIGFHYRAAGKVMGLAAYGKPIWADTVYNCFEPCSCHLSIKKSGMFARASRKRYYLPVGMATMTQILLIARSAE